MLVIYLSDPVRVSILLAHDFARAIRFLSISSFFVLKIFLTSTSNIILSNWWYRGDRLSLHRTLSSSEKFCIPGNCISVSVPPDYDEALEMPDSPSGRRRSRRRSRLSRSSTGGSSRRNRPRFPFFRSLSAQETRWQNFCDHISCQHLSWTVSV